MTDPISPLGGKGLAVSTASGGTARQADAGRPEAQEAVEPETAATSQTDLLEMAKTVEARLQEASKDLSFQVDQDTGIMTFKVIDASTHKVIREYPPEEVLAMAKYIKESLQSKDPGVLVDLQN